MKAIKSISLLTKTVGFLSLILIFSSANAQEYDDMYFSKSDRKTIKVEKTNINTNTPDYKEVTKSTETYSAKNINPEYIARYKSTESNEVNEQQAQKDDAYSSQDYFVEDYNNTEYISNPNNNKIDYAALNKRDQMSTPSKSSNYNNAFSSPSWRFSPYMSMGMGYGGGYGYNPYRMGYDPYMMGSGSGMAMGFGSGFGISPSLSFHFGMSSGYGYNPYSRYSNFHNPYGMSRYNDPWGSMYGSNSFNRYGQSPYNNSGYGGFCPSYATAFSNNNTSSDINGGTLKYQPRTTRANVNQRDLRNDNAENTRVASSDSKIRVPIRRDVSSSASNGRVSKDYSKVQNEYYSRTKRSSASTQRISSVDSRSRATSSRSSNSASRYSSSINNNKPSRTSSYSTGSSRSSSANRYTSGSSKRSSSYSPSRSSSSKSSFSSGNSGGSRSSSSFSSGGSSSRSSSGSSSSSSPSRSSSGGGSSRSGRQ